MDYRRNEGFIGQSSLSLRLRDPCENTERGAASHRSIRRSVSPPAMMPQDVILSQRAGSDERNEYGGWAVDRARVVRAVRSRSPSAVHLGDARKRPHYDNEPDFSPRNYSPTPLAESRQRRGEMGEPKISNFDNDGAEFHGVKGYGYDPSDPRASKAEFNEIGFSASDKHQFDGQDSVPAKVLAQGSYRSPTNLDPNAALVYGVTGEKLPSISRAMDAQQNFEQGRVQYQEGMASDRLPMTQHSYKDGEKPVFQTRDVAYQVMPGSNSKGFLNSPEMSRREYLAYQDSLYEPQTVEFKSSVKLSEPTNLVAYRERSDIASARIPEGSQRNTSFYMREYSPDMGEHESYYYVKSRKVIDERGYPDEEMHNIVAAPRAHHNNGRTQIIYDDREMPASTSSHAFFDRNGNINSSSGNLRRGIRYFHPEDEEPIDPDYLDIPRASHAPKQGGEYLRPRFSRVEIARTIAEDHQILHVGASKNHRVVSDVDADYIFEEDLGRQFQEERLPHSSGSKYETDMYRHNGRPLNVRDVPRIYRPQERLVKGKYRIQEGPSSKNSRNKFQGKIYSGRQYEELHETSDEWVGEETREVFTSTTRGFLRPGFRRTERKYDGIEDHEAFESEEWLPSREFSNVHKHSVGFHKSYDRNMKGDRRPVFTNRHNSQQFDRKDQHYRQQNNYDRRNQTYRQNNHYDRKNHVYRQQKIWNRLEGGSDNMVRHDGNNDSNPSEDWVGHKESVPTENSEKFKQLVHEALLRYTRILNSNSAVQRRYKEEGKAGSLFCAVCGRSASKEFMDTRRLATHAFMSHKTGLRADHLGLLKAICVLMGWSSIIPEDTITFVPQFLPRDQALAQKEDLILWPPVVVIHNISLSDRNPENWKVITMEEIETFLRGKGFIRGRIRIVLGKPADQSVLIVKFLGTFTGLGDAEKIHKYFAESKRGRLDLETPMLKAGGEIKANKEGETMEENNLYGYLGISEDLDRVDYTTRNTGLIKSKIDILDLANAPVKNEETQQ